MGSQISLSPPTHPFPFYCNTLWNIYALIPSDEHIVIWKSKLVLWRNKATQCTRWCSSPVCCEILHSTVLLYILKHFIKHGNRIRRFFLVIFSLRNVILFLFPILTSSIWLIFYTTFGIEKALLNKMKTNKAGVGRQGSEPCTTCATTELSL